VAPPDPGTLLLTPEGDCVSCAWLTERMKAAETGMTRSCHLFRHRCATLMLEGGADVRYTQEMLGHAELSTTQIYTRVSIRRSKAVHALTHPSAKLERPVAAALSADERAVREGQAVKDAAAGLLNTLAVEADEDE
jgi:integrase/recombinase XerD